MMQIQQIRNATLRITYAGKVFITDPYLAGKHTMPSNKGISQNPTADLPCSEHDAIEGIEMALISHIHSGLFCSLKMNPKYIGPEIPYGVKLLMMLLYKFSLILSSHILVALYGVIMY